MSHVKLANFVQFLLTSIIFEFFLQNLDPSIIPRTECLKDTVTRALPYWFDEIIPSMKVMSFL